MTIQIKGGSTSRMIHVAAFDATTGLPYTTGAYNDAGVALWYRRGVAGAKTTITAATQTVTGAYSSGGFVHVADGIYRLDLPDAAIATGVDEVQVGGSATAWKLIAPTIQITGYDPRTDAVATVAGKLDANVYTWNGTAVATPDTAGYPKVTVKSGSGTGEIATLAGAVSNVGTVATLTTYTGNTPQTGDAYARIGAAGAGLTAVGDTAGTTTLLSRITALIQTKAEADTAHGLLATSANLATVAGYLDTEVAAILAAVDTEVSAIKAKTDNLPTDPADQSQVEAAITAVQSALAVLIGALNDIAAADVWAALDDASANKIADHTLRRAWASAAGSADGDALAFRSLLGAVAKLVNRVGIVGDTLTVYEDDDTTALGEQTLTSDADAEPITGVNTV